MNVGGKPTRISQFFPDMNACKHLPADAIQTEELLGEVCGVKTRGLRKEVGG